jgi:hypothetical protein
VIESDRESRRDDRESQGGCLHERGREREREIFHWELLYKPPAREPFKSNSREFFK